MTKWKALTGLLGWLLIGNACQEVRTDGMEAKARAAKDKAAVLGTWDFDKGPIGKTPEEWSILQNNPTKALARWTVEADPAAPSKPNVLSIRTDNDNATFNLAIFEKASAKDLDLSVKIKAHTGKHDQGGGLMWRVKDENNYYVCRINPLEDNFRVYKVVDGKRTQIQSAKATPGAEKWHTVRAVMVGDHIECYLNGEKLLDAKDDTFKDAGKIGLWTKADASSSFDDVDLLLSHGHAGAGTQSAQDRAT